jgi:hypothetical protein
MIFGVIEREQGFISSKRKSLKEKGSNARLFGIKSHKP